MNLDHLMKIRAFLQKSPYTTYQVKDFMKVAHLLQLYALSGGKIIINPVNAVKYTEPEKLYLPDFEPDNLTLWNRPISADEIFNS